MNYNTFELLIGAVVVALLCVGAFILGCLPWIVVSLILF